MLGCAKRAGSSTIMRISIRKFDPLEAKMAQKRAEMQQAQQQQQQLGSSDQVSSPSSDAQKTMYATKSDFKQTVVDTRFQGAADAETGQIPTRMQRRFLVITKLYPTVDDIPQYVHNGTMNRMHDRMRAVYIIVASFFFFSTFYIAERSMAAKISRDRDAGVVVTKM